MTNSHFIQDSIRRVRICNVIFGFVLAASTMLTGRAQTALVVTQISPAPSGSINSSNGVLVVQWTGGTAPFQVQTCSSPGGAWQDVAGATSASSQTNIPTEPTAFYRVVSVAGAFSTRTDTNAPSVPNGLTTTATSSSQIDLTWSASTDTGNNATGVKGYNVYRNGVFLKQVLAPSTSISEVGLAPLTRYTNTVSAVDNAYNDSAQSNPLIVTTLANGTCTNTISTSSSPADGGSISGGGTVNCGSSVTVTATPSACYSFVSWTEGDTVVSTSASYSFAVSGPRSLVANFMTIPCTYSLSPTSASFGAAGGSGSVTVTASAPSCPWAASTTYDWIHITSRGTGSGTASYSMDANTSTSARPGTLTIAGQTFTVSQAAGTDGTPPSVSLTAPTNDSLVSGTIAPAASASDNVGVTRVEFYRDGTSLVGIATAAPYTVLDDTTKVPNGSHGYSAKAYDMAGNSTTSPTNTVTVSNQASAPGQFQWVVTPVSSLSDYGNAIVTDTNGDVLVTGRWIYGPSVFLARYSASGALLWWETFAATGTPRAIALDRSGSIFITGDYFGSANFGGIPFSGGGMVIPSMFVAKFSSTGAHLWSKGFSAAGPNSGRGVVVDGSGNIVLTGAFSSLDFGGGVMTGSSSGSLFVANLSGVDGSYLWAKQFGTGSSAGNGIALDGSGNLFVTGYFFSAMDFGAVHLTSIMYGGFLVKLSASGTPVWSKGFGSFSNDPGSYGYGGNSVSVASNGDAVITGGFVGTLDFGGGPLTTSPYSVFDIFFARLSNSGTYLWSQHVTSSLASSGIGYGATLDQSGNMLFTGRLYGTADFGCASTLTGEMGSDQMSTFVVKYSPTGTGLWANVYGGANFGAGIDTDMWGNVLVTGNWSGNADFGGGLLSSQGGPDAFLLKLAP